MVLVHNSQPVLFHLGQVLQLTPQGHSGVAPQARNQGYSQCQEYPWLLFSNAGECLSRDMIVLKYYSLKATAVWLSKEVPVAKQY